MTNICKHCIDILIGHHFLSIGTLKLRHEGMQTTGKKFVTHVTKLADSQNDHDFTTNICF